MKRHVFLLASAAAVVAVSLTAAQTSVQSSPAGAVDSVFAQWTATSPGCAVGVSVGGRPVIERAYGMADLEREVPNKPDTIFEAGSVSKQFTAAAVLLLARDGKLSIDDPVRKYVPELPEYSAGVVTIRHMLTHTSGLRDWGEVAGIAGWPRGRRVHTHAHVLDIASRQKALNFPPGTNWSYSNTGYNLSAIIVARVSGQSFADFSRDRIFAPMGMTRTSWRDDYTRIVKHRAIAYEPAGSGYREDMPFENVHGNGGLLTTVGDLLRWNEHFSSPSIADGKFVTEQQTPGRFADGRPHEYAMGLYVRPYRGVPEVSHSGSTAGYRAYLARYPEQRASVAVLCNAASANPAQYAHAVAEAYLPGAFSAPARSTTGGGGGAQMPQPFTPADADLSAYPGRYRSDEAEVDLTVARENGELVVRRRPDTVLRMRAVARDVFAVPTLGTVTFHRTAATITELSVKLDRVWDLRFTRIP